MLESTATTLFTALESYVSFLSISQMKSLLFTLNVERKMF